MANATISTGQPPLAPTSTAAALDMGAALLLRRLQAYSRDILQFIATSASWLAGGNAAIRLSAVDAQLIVAHFQEMSASDRYLRFGFSPTEYQLVTYVTGIKFGHDVVLGVVRDEKLVAFCHLGIYPEQGHDVGELGISLLEVARGKGLAYSLMDLCFAESAKRGVGLLYVNYLARNTPMAALCRKFGATLARDGCEVTAKMVVSEYLASKSSVALTLPVSYLDGPSVSLEEPLLDADGIAGAW